MSDDKNSAGTKTPPVEYAEYKETDQQLESAGQNKTLTRPARVFTPEEEKKLYRKVDIRIMPILALLYLLSFMDRGNIGNARLSGLEKDLSMTGSDYNIALSLYFVSYCLFEVPANLMLKKLRPSIWLASIPLFSDLTYIVVSTVLWGVVMTLMGVVQSFAGLVVCRVALGIAEAGLFPGVVLYLTLWYPRHECQYRIALFFAAATMAGAFSGLLAYAIQFMSGIAGLNGWRWIFILEGILTVVAGFGAFFAIADLPADCKFLTADEQAWILWRKQSDNSSVGEAEGVSWTFIGQAFGSWQVWISTLYYISIVTPLYGIGLFLPTIINAFGKYTRPQVQLLTVPVYLVACTWVVTAAYLGDKMKKRFLFVTIGQLLCLVGFVINISPAPSGVKYFGLFLCASGSYGALPAVVTWLGNNLSGQTKRGVGMAIQIGIGNFGGICASNIYRSVDAPHYYLGHGIEIGLVCMGLVVSPLYAWMLTRENAKKEAYQLHQDSLPDSEKRVYTVEELRILGDKAPEFMYTI